MNNNIAFACPYCFENLDDKLACQCGFTGIKVIPNKFAPNDCFYELHRSDETWKDCLGQNEAVKRADEASARPLPPSPPPAPPRSSVADRTNDTMHNKCMELLGDIKGTTFLDLGGQSGWACRRFIEHGADFGILVDIEIMHRDRNPKGFINVIADGYYMPFADNQFDFVFDCSTLHHFLDKDKVLKEINRVLKDGALYVNQGNMPRPQGYKNDQFDENSWDAQYKKYGLIETWMTKNEYQNHYEKVFKDLIFYPIAGNNMVVVMKKRNE